MPPGRELGQGFLLWPCASHRGSPRAPPRRQEEILIAGWTGACKQGWGVGGRQAEGQREAGAEQWNPKTPFPHSHTWREFGPSEPGSEPQVPTPEDKLGRIQELKPTVLNRNIPLALPGQSLVSTWGPFAKCPVVPLKWVKVLVDFATPRTVSHQAPLSIGFPRQEYWSRLPFLSLTDFEIHDCFSPNHTLFSSFNRRLWPFPPTSPPQVTPCSSSGMQIGTSPALQELTFEAGWTECGHKQRMLIGKKCYEGK